MHTRGFAVGLSCLVGLVHVIPAGCHAPGERPQRVMQAPPAPTSQATRNGQDRVGLIVDIDETISITDYPSLILGIGTDESRPHRNARDVLLGLSEHFDITYLTARPQWLTVQTRRWLTDRGFPSGTVLTTARMLDVYWPGSFKKRAIAALRRSSPNLLIGIGDRRTDAQAYLANDMVALVVNPRRGAVYDEHAEVMKDWEAIGAFFDEHLVVLRDPASLRAAYDIGGPPLDPSTVRTRPEIDLSLLIELPLLVPTLLVEGIAKAGLAHEQAEARSALEQVNRPFAEVLQEVVEQFGQNNLLKLHLATEDGLAVYVVTFLQGQRVMEIELDESLEVVEEPEEVPLFGDDPTALHAHARLGFTEALARSMKEVEGDVYEIELEMDDDRPTYETALRALGRFMEIEIDAQTGEVIEIEDETAIR